MKKRVIIRLLFFPLFIVLILVGYKLYRNVYYLNGKHLDLATISPENYRELPKNIELWPGTFKLISGSNYNQLTGNNKVKKIERFGGQTVRALPWLDCLKMF